MHQWSTFNLVIFIRDSPKRQINLGALQLSLQVAIPKSYVIFSATKLAFDSFYYYYHVINAGLFSDEKSIAIAIANNTELI